jgi:RNA polymerase sigma-70 factor (ECF subfamily)
MSGGAPTSQSDAVFAFGITGDHVTRIWAIRNPDKLRPWATG